MCLTGFLERRVGESIATVSLSLRRFGFRFVPSICRYRPSHVYFGLELSLLVPAHETFVALVRFDDCAPGYFFSCHAAESSVASTSVAEAPDFSSWTAALCPIRLR